jgi:hypothetical protein
MLQAMDSGRKREDAPLLGFSTLLCGHMMDSLSTSS